MVGRAIIVLAEQTPSVEMVAIDADDLQAAQDRDTAANPSAEESPPHRGDFDAG
jgi:hypothetical protein